MSATATNQPVLPEPQEAFDNLVAGVHQRVFFHKLACCGRVPRTQREAVELLKLGAELRQSEELLAVKQAQEGASPFAQARTLLHEALQAHGMSLGQQKQAQEEELAIRDAAAALCQDATIYNSVLSLKAYEAGQYAQGAA